MIIFSLCPYYYMRWERIFFFFLVTYVFWFMEFSTEHRLIQSKILIPRSYDFLSPHIFRVSTSTHILKHHLVRFLESISYISHRRKSFSTGSSYSIVCMYVCVYIHNPLTAPNNLYILVHP